MRSTPPPLTPPLTIGSARRLFGSFTRTARGSFNFPTMTISEPDTEADADSTSKTVPSSFSCCPLKRSGNRPSARKSEDENDVEENHGKTVNCNNSQSNNGPSVKNTPTVVVENVRKPELPSVIIQNEEEQPLAEGFQKEEKESEEDICTSAL